MTCRIARTAAHFCGPDDFADVILAARRDADGEEACFGNISADGVRLSR